VPTSVRGPRFRRASSFPSDPPHPARRDDPRDLSLVGGEARLERLMCRRGRVKA
jgi:hypothetical protein